MDKIILYSLYCSLVVALAFPSTFSLPRHRESEYTVDEPDPIPVHLLRVPMQVDIPNSPKDFPEISSAFKRSGGRNHLQLSDTTESCCPIEKEIIEPEYGKSREGDLVELYQTESVRQRFYEISCAPAVVNHPCRYLDKKHESLSRCEQQYTYSYALVRDVSLDGSMSEKQRLWRLDYIVVRSGCSCQISSIQD